MLNVFKKIVKRINPARKGRAEKLAASRERDKKSELTLDGNWKLKQTDSIAVQRNLRLDLYDVITRIKKKIGSQRKIRFSAFGRRYKELLRDCFPPRFARGFGFFGRSP